jgi:ABC-type amino acid transport substrate-binding protein
MQMVRFFYLALLLSVLSYSCQEEKKTSKADDKPVQTEDKVNDEIVKVYVASPGSSSLPFYSWDEKDSKPIGIGPRLIEYVLNQANIEFEFISDYVYEGGGDPRISSVTSGAADVSIRGITINEDRKKEVLFSDVYYTNGLGIMVAGSSDLFTLKDLEGKKIYALRFSTSYNWAEENLSSSVLLSPEDFGIDQDPIGLLKQGKIDAYLTDQSALKRKQKNHRDTRIFPEKLTEEGYGIAISKNRPDLLEKINKVLSEMRESGRLQDFTKEFEN